MARHLTEEPVDVVLDICGQAVRIETHMVDLHPVYEVYADDERVGQLEVHNHAWYYRRSGLRFRERLFGPYASLTAAAAALTRPLQGER